MVHLLHSSSNDLRLPKCRQDNTSLHRHRRQRLVNVFLKISNPNSPALSPIALNSAVRMKVGFQQQMREQRTTRTTWSAHIQKEVFFRGEEAENKRVPINGANRGDAAQVRRETQSAGATAAAASSPSAKAKLTCAAAAEERRTKNEKAAVSAIAVGSCWCSLKRLRDGRPTPSPYVNILTKKCKTKCECKHYSNFSIHDVQYTGTVHRDGLDKNKNKIWILSGSRLKISLIFFN